MAAHVVAAASTAAASSRRARGTGSRGPSAARRPSLVLAPPVAAPPVSRLPSLGSLGLGTAASLQPRPARVRVVRRVVQALSPGPLISPFCVLALHRRPERRLRRRPPRVRRRRGRLLRWATTASLRGLRLGLLLLGARGWRWQETQAQAQEAEKTPHPTLPPRRGRPRVRRRLLNLLDARARPRLLAGRSRLTPSWPRAHRRERPRRRLQGMIAMSRVGPSHSSRWLPDVTSFSSTSRRSAPNISSAASTTRLAPRCATR